jgi:hypothetical protein
MSPILTGVIASGISGNLASPTAFESISTTVVGAGGSSGFDFSSIPSTYKHLQIRTYHKQPVDKDLIIRFNGDTAANYSSHNIRGGNGSATSSGGVANIGNPEWAYDLNVGNDDSYWSSVIDILDYGNTSKAKTVRMFYGNSSSSGSSVWFQSLLWTGTDAINAINITTNGTPTNTLFQHSHFALYGIKG